MNILQARERLGLSQEQFAELLKVTGRTVQNWEAGRSTPKQHQLDEIKRWLSLFPDGMVVAKPKSDFSRLIGIIEEQQRQIDRLTLIIEQVCPYNIKK